MSDLKLCSLTIVNYRQFRHTRIDFTHPETGKPLDRVCLIGKNGTGKTTVLELLRMVFSGILKNNIDANFSKSLIMAEFEIEGSRILILNIKTKVSQKNSLNNIIHVNSGNFKFSLNYIFLKVDDKLTQFINELFSANIKIDSIKQKILDKFSNDFLNYQDIKISWNLFVHSLSESLNNPLVNQKVPQTNLNEAITKFIHYPKSNDLDIVSNGTTNIFWQLLIFLINKRDEKQKEFENRKENFDKTKRELVNEFNEIEPDSLVRLQEVWNPLLERSNLELDIENYQKPLSLTANLQLFTKIKGSKTQLPYNELSTGIRNYLFRLGHICALHFNREVKRGFLLVDEPENSLFPDFRLDLVDIYKEATRDRNGEYNTQIFMATHDPIIAAQFKPEERIILDWDDDMGVIARRGVAAEGDDPNDILLKDFRMPHLMGKAGRKAWEKYLEKQVALLEETDETVRKTLRDEILELGLKYNFEA